MTAHRSFRRFVLAVTLGLSAAAARGESNVIVFNGMCDASAAAAIDAEHFVVADDEDNTLRIYRVAGGEPVYSAELSLFLGNAGTKKPKEADLEAAAQIQKYTFWITSHGRNSKGKDKPERQRLFATEAIAANGSLEIKAVGEPYIRLLDDLLAHPDLTAFNLEAASKLAPKTAGALNIEGMAGTPEGHLLIAFRNPVPDGKALIVPLLNPTEVIKGQEAKLGSPIQLNLQGLGIRGIDYCDGRYLIIAGAHGEGGDSKLFEWDGKAEPKLLSNITLSGFNPEGIAFQQTDGKGRYLLLSDDGSVQVDGQSCKDLKDQTLKSFRGRVIRF
jgi:hypothetical protein